MIPEEDISMDSSSFDSDELADSVTNTAGKKKEPVNIQVKTLKGNFKRRESGKGSNQLLQSITLKQKKESLF